MGDFKQERGGRKPYSIHFSGSAANEFCSLSFFLDCSEMRGKVPFGGRIQASGWAKEREKGGGLEESATSTTTLLLLLGVLRGQGIDLTNEIVEDLFNVVLGLGRSLNKAAVETLGQVLALLGGDDALVGQIALVSNQHHWHLIGILHTQDLITQLGQIVEGGLSNDTIDQNEALAILHVKVAHRRELFSSGGIENLKHVAVIVDFHELTVGILNGGIVLLNEDTLDELDSQARLTDLKSQTAGQKTAKGIPSVKVCVRGLFFKRTPPAPKTTIL
jgi:hypothetical protein